MSSSSATRHKQLHVALFPWLAFGHIIPFLEVAKHIARKGHKVSFISTPRNIQRLPKIPETLTPLITLVQIPLPHVENLPENAEATMDVPHDVIPYLKIAHDGLEQGISEFLQAQSPDWIIHDFAPHWLPPIATKLGISNAHFSIFNASTLCFLGSTSPNRVSRYAPRKKLEQYTSPPEWIPFPSKIYYRPFEAKRLVNGILTPNASGVTDHFRLESTIQGCQVYFIRSCREIEGEWLDLLEDLHEKPVVLPTGLLPPSLPRSDEDGGKDSDWSKIAEWLDKQEKGKVVYVAFGSELNLSQEEFNELALGLELSGLPFFWVLRKPSNGSGDGDSVKLPDGFEDRTKGRGHVWTTWAPQLKILSHESVGGFLTHCGWSSIIESLQYGRPLIMLPFMYDQGLIARFWDNKIGAEVPRDEETGWFTRNELANSLKLIVVDEEGKQYRDGANDYSKLFRDKELHDRYMDECVEYLETHAHHEV
ncbi:PREDICTED: putative UDP-rhamnose:rhamnosyltransferase 1 [Fragaria vesca subsp. vesca]|uniref:putative UDP-rhamnose:rhamnosyltransferase 1 n=1 Tax=Fragaria vesca subsp. vesca TaxID=101020 RepID=UPI0002C32EC6|nr:PREDICTED: putative UDP-rhamnose:rhamnosyltransferase 1 [Fragaria vesca subsp. vesca]